MLIAQAMGEYGGATLVAEVFAQGRLMVATLRNVEPSTWAAVGFAAFGVWFVLSRFR